MTKKEAFDYLKGTKVVLKTEDEQVKLQEFLFSIGYKWPTGDTKAMKLYPDVCVFFMNPSGYITHNGYDDEEDISFCDTHVYKELIIDDILAIEIGKNWKDVFKDVQDTLKDKQIMVISKDKVLIIDL
jgi:hypothetical protein